MTPRSARAAQRLVEALTAGGQKIAVAESLTGGLASLRLTRTVGAAGVFVGGVVCYRTVPATTACEQPGGRSAALSI